MRAGWSEVVVVEAAPRVGGHARTVELGGEGSGGAKVDIGFQVFNLANYPLLTQLFDELGVEHAEVLLEGRE